MPAGCPTCAELDFVQELRTPADLRQAIRVGRQRVDGGTLADALDGSPIETPFSELAVDGPWPDIVSASLACTACGRRFSLTCETYHGAGGRWAPDPDAAPS